MEFKSGFVSILGRPNVGKSTLVNALIGEKIAIVSDKPQTTRNKIQCVLTSEKSQIIFIDTPGIVRKANTKLGEYMEKSTVSAYKGVDLLIFITTPGYIGSGDKAILANLAKIKLPTFLVINKIDTVTEEILDRTVDSFSDYRFNEIIKISALKGTVAGLIPSIEKYLKPGPRYFPDDMITDRPQKYIVAEFLREKALHNLRQEIPHGIAVEILEMKFRGDIVDIDADIYCEKDSHKGMVIGKNGENLKKIAAAARIDMENLLGTKVNLQVWVRVKDNWRNSDFFLKNAGYDFKKI